MKAANPPRLPAEGEWFRICGQPCKEGELYCSKRCAYIAGRMQSPLGQNMSMKRAIRFFGKMYDKQQQASSQPAAKKRK